MALQQYKYVLLYNFMSYKKPHFTSRLSIIIVKGCVRERKKEKQWKV